MPVPLMSLPMRSTHEDVDGVERQPRHRGPGLDEELRLAGLDPGGRDGLHAGEAGVAVLDERDAEADRRPGDGVARDGRDQVGERVVAAAVERVRAHAACRGRSRASS